MGAALASPTCATLLQTAEARLRDADIATARLDAEVLLAMALGTTRAGVYARLQHSLEADLVAHFAGLIDRRARREPIAYITGVQEFWSLPFAVTPAVLIPRPETELLVEIVCGLVERGDHDSAGGSPPFLTFPRTGGRDPKGRARGSSDRDVYICDVGTGSGCVAVALASELPSARIVATDVCADALSVASANAERHGVGGRIRFVRGDLLEAIGGDTSFDVIVSNPPYLAPDDAVSPELAFEPRLALAAGIDGLDVVRRLITTAAKRLLPSGWLVMELGRGQESGVCELARAAGFSSVAVEPDLAGIPRAVVARRPSSEKDRT